jgi:hypothetical protein
MERIPLAFGPACPFVLRSQLGSQLLCAEFRGHGSGFGRFRPLAHFCQYLVGWSPAGRPDIWPADVPRSQLHAVRH